MARAIWSGAITFGLVSVPVKLVTTVRDKGVRFNLLHDADKVRLRRKLVCPADDQEVPQEHQIHGYQVAPDQYVVVSDEEMESLQVERRRTIEIMSSRISIRSTRSTSSNRTTWCRTSWA